MDLNLIIHGAIIGLVISIIELYFVHADEDSFGFKVWFTHGWHAIPWTTGLTIVNLLGYYSYQTIAPYLPIPIPPIAIPFVIFIFSAIKLHSTTLILGKLGEKWVHVLIISLLVALTPFYYPYIASYLPNFF
jgi:hypothetical protein